jgi:hypothetical protein
MGYRGHRLHAPQAEGPGRCKQTPGPWPLETHKPPTKAARPSPNNRDGETGSEVVIYRRIGSFLKRAGCTRGVYHRYSVEALSRSSSVFFFPACSCGPNCTAQLKCCASALPSSPSLLKPPSFPLPILLYIALLRAASALQQDLWEAHAVTAIERARQRTGTPR